MLLAIDIGNTHIVLGLYDGEKLAAHWRLQSDVHRTVDEYSLQIHSLLDGASFSKSDIKSVIISCVVPELARVFNKLSAKYLAVDPLSVGPGIKTGIEVHTDDPRSVGADRIVNSIAAKELHGFPAVVVDFGTATTFDVIGKEGNYEGGLISPGLLISAEALAERAAKLQNIELRAPKVFIGKNTQDSMLSGIVFGYVSLVEGIVGRLKETVGNQTKVIATGGLATLINNET